jgi:hypothetical protein
MKYVLAITCVVCGRQSMRLEREEYQVQDGQGGACPSGRSGANAFPGSSRAASGSAYASSCFCAQTTVSTKRPAVKPVVSWEGRRIGPALFFSM